MPQSAHFKNNREGIGREGLTPLGGNLYQSCCWAINEAEAQSLVGGWIYLHDTKNDDSAMGGVVQSVEPAPREGVVRHTGYAITFHARTEGRGQKWRGASHTMAWWSGLVAFSAAHEGTI